MTEHRKTDTEYARDHAVRALDSFISAYPNREDLITPAFELGVRDLARAIRLLTTRIERTAAARAKREGGPAPLPNDQPLPL